MKPRRDLRFHRRAPLVGDDRCWLSCGLPADSADCVRPEDDVIRGPIQAVLRGQATAPQPAEGAGCSGSPEGRCASLRDGPTAHPSPGPLQPEQNRLWGTARNMGALMGFKRLRKLTAARTKATRPSISGQSLDTKGRVNSINLISDGSIGRRDVPVVDGTTLLTSFSHRPGGSSGGGPGARAAFTSPDLLMA
jgi:hypothetical protein